MKEEQVILVNEKDEAIGLCPKMEAHKKALLHRAFSVFIFNNKGKLLLQQRAAHKYHSPKLWTNTVCSHQRKGESNLQAGKRRLSEEMGMQANLEEIFHFIYRAEFDNGLTEHELDHVMIGYSNEKPLINPNEVMDYKWEKLENIASDIEKNPHNYTEWFKIIFANSLEKLQEKLAEHFLSYPIHFKPIFKEKPWGGKKLKTILHKNIPFEKTGESWEISALSNEISIVDSGYFKNKTLLELIKKYREKIIGKKIYQKFGNNFPLLIKFIDAAKDLSVQVHPNDEIAWKNHQTSGKNELWHILQAESDSVLYIGLKKGTNLDKYLTYIREGKLEKLLNRIPAHSGDTYYIPAGTIHSIGKGILLAEIQQTSDLTYRIYDWNRKGLDGKPRTLHTELALQAINLNAQTLKPTENLIKTPYFTIEKLQLNTNTVKKIAKLDSFIILINTGNGKFIVNEHMFKKGNTLFIPAITPELNIQILKKGEILMIYL